MKNFLKTLALTAVFAATASAQVIGVKATGAGVLVEPSTLQFPNAGPRIADTDASTYLSLVAGSNLSAPRSLTLVTGDTNRSITLSGNPTLADWFDQSVKSGTAPTFLGTNFSAIPNGALSNSAITIGGASTSLGGTVTATTILDSVGSTRGSINYRGASGWSSLTPGTVGLPLLSGGAGADPSYATLGVTGGGNGLTTATLGDLRYGSGTNTLAALTGNTSTTMAVLTQTGNGSASAAPVWTSTTGTGNLVRATSPTIVTPTIASITAPSLTDFTVAGGSSGASLTLGQGNTGATLTIPGVGGLTIYVNGQKFLHTSGGGGGGAGLGLTNLFMGQGAGGNFGSSTAYADVVIGPGAGASLSGTNPLAAANSLFGYTTGGSLVGGSFNDVSGAAALSASASSVSMVVKGHHAAAGHTGSYGVISGEAAAAQGSGDGIVATGHNAHGPNSATTAAHNVVEGEYSFESITSGTDNFGGGDQTGRAVTTGSRLTLIGAKSGYQTLTTGHDVLLAGSNTGTTKSDLANSSAIGPGAQVNEDNAIVVGDSNVTKLTTAARIITTNSSAAAIDVNGRFSVHGTTGAAVITGTAGTLQISGNMANGAGTVNSQYGYLNTSNGGGNNSGVGFRDDATLPNSVTSSYTAFLSNVSTAATSFTVGSISGFVMNNGTKGSGSTVTVQRGLLVGPLTNGGTISGIELQVASAANRWNINATGTAANQLTGPTTIGASGSAVDLILTATATLDFPSIAADGGTQDLTITVTGASTGDTVVLGLPAAPNAGVVFNAWPSSSNTITVRATNATTGAIDPASASYRVTVISH